MVHDEHSLQERAAALAERLLAESARLAIVESCTGGLLAKVLTDVPGASRWFERGLVVYSNAAKQNLLGITEDLLNRHGAVSEPVAKALATGLLASAPVDYAVAITGIAGPGGGSAEKPVGTVWIAWAGADRVAAKRLQLSGDRNNIRINSAAAAIDALHGV